MLPTPALLPWPLPLPLPLPLPFPSLYFDDASDDYVEQQKHVTVTLEKSFLVAWLEAHEHRQDPGKHGRRIEHFIGENEHWY